MIGGQVRVGSAEMCHSAIETVRAGFEPERHASAVKARSGAAIGVLAVEVIGGRCDAVNIYSPRKYDFHNRRLLMFAPEHRYRSPDDKSAIDVSERRQVEGFFTDRRV